MFIVDSSNYARLVALGVFASAEGAENSQERSGGGQAQQCQTVTLR
jgi:hypothetical protein